MVKLLIRVDGSCIPNPGNMAIGVVIYRDGQLWKKINEIIGQGTNNIAEYSAVIRGLEEIKDIPSHSVQFYCDSQLIVKQLNGQFKVKNKKMIPLYERIQELVKEIKAPVFFIWNRREDNQMADQLARKLLLKEEQNKRALASQDLTVEDKGDHFLIQNKQNKKIYRVNLSLPECDCYDFENNCRKWNLECKHIVATRKFVEEREKQKSNDKDIVKKMKVLIFSKMVKAEKWSELLEKYNRCDNLPLELIFPHPDSKELSRQLASVEVIVGGELGEFELNQAKKLKLFQIPFTGVDKQNLEVFKNYTDVTVCNTHGNSDAVSEQAFSLLLALAKNLLNNDRDLRRGIWHGFVTGEPAIQVKGKNLAVIGLGTIGLEIAKRALAFGMKIYAIKQTIKKEEELEQKYGLTFLGTPEQLEYVIA
ncbi:MAG TPA: reverse transcriptase-like protein, partial [Atribacterota bacterium]|nr:reverse transcriptase-like protein [Atribacterota bacterium]